VSAYDSASVSACDSASVRAYDSASVRAYGSASVRAYGSASVSAYDSASVSACDSASVSACDSASVSASGSASVRATPFVAVQSHGKHVKANGGVLIQIPELDTLKAWVGYYGLSTADGRVTVYKLVSDDLVSGHGTTYPVGEEVACDDWAPGAFCGNGLHFSPRPFMARAYFWEGTRFLECTVAAKDVVLLGDKLKAPSCRVVREVDEDGEPLPERVAVAA
jgi:hypothetical protein